MEENKKETKKRSSFVKELIPYVVILLVVVLIRSFLITPIVVKGESMQPTLDGGELMLLKKQYKLERYDIVVVDIKKEKIIKRIIALPGESIYCENGTIYVNDEKQEEEYGTGKTPDFPKVFLSEDEYFVLGDNRENSLDSQELGPFKKEAIAGKTDFVLFPFSKIGKIK